MTDLSCSARAEQSLAETLPSEVLLQLLHDDVLSEIRLSVLRLEIAGKRGSTTWRELLDLEHRLRRRCLERRTVERSASVDEIVQLHIRRARSHGLHTRTVVHETAHLCPEYAQRAHRALSIVVDNALQAGATEIEIQAHIRPTHLQIVVIDDAGGFDLTAVPAGSSIACLRDEWGPLAFTRQDSSRGSAVFVRVPAADGAQSAATNS